MFIFRIASFLFAASSLTAAAAPADATAIQIAAGGLHTCLLTAAGGVKCWGGNNRGQLGDGSFSASSAPINTATIVGGATAIAAGGSHTCALATGGGVKCWGYNNNGQLGNNSLATSGTPVDVVGLTSGIAAIDAGFEHTCALTTTGGVKCWGANATGALGDNSTTRQLVPVDVNGLGSGVVAISAGVDHTCAITTSNGIKCWGNNDQGQIGDGTQNMRLVPTDVSGLATGSAQVSAGAKFTCALLTSGGVKCWGANTLGSVGSNGGQFMQLTPVDVAGLSSGVAAIASAGSDYNSSGDGHTCALLQAGPVLCWGRGSNGQLGKIATGNNRIPVLAFGLSTGVTGLAASVFHTCALTAGGGVKCWGYGSNGQLGDGSATDSPSPVNVVGFERQIISIAGGGNHACSLTEGGKALCWGANDSGNVGDGTISPSRPLPVGVTLPSTSTNPGGATGVAAGGQHSCAITATFSIRCWGNNAFGQLGNGTTMTSSSPVQVGAYSTTNRTLAVSVGGTHTCAISQGGVLRCWGRNTNGQLGNNSFFSPQTSPSSPVYDGNFSRALQVSAGGQHTCAVDQFGGVQCWGANTNGQLGNNSVVDQFAPVDVTGLDYSSNSTRAIAAGNAHACALTSTGAVKCWGANNWGQLGDGSYTQRLVPADVIGLASGVAAITAGGDITCALMLTGVVKCWGSNANGELGIGMVGGSRNVATDVPQFSGGGAVSVSAGNGIAFALLPDSSVVGWGLANAGRLGNNATLGNFPLPIQTLGVGGNGNLRLAASDTFPAPFTLQSRFGVGRNEVVNSNPVTVSGITSAATVTITGGLVSIDGGSYFAGPGSVANGGIVRVRVTASANYDTLSVATLNIGGQTASFQVRTRKNPSDASVVPAVALGENFTLILGSNGLVYGAGYNGTRQMGNGSTLNATAHAPVAGLTNIRRIAAGGNHALALRSDGTVVAWGYNAAGQLGGAGAANSSGYPTQVALLTGVAEIAAGQNHSVALKSDGSLWAWGLNTEGQLGTGNTVSSATPVQVLTGVQSVTAGARHTLAIKSNGTLWSWGANESGQLGSGNTTPRATPTQVGVITNWLAIAGGSAHALALRTDGTVYAWGANGKGQLGDGTVIGKTVPTLIASLTAIASVAAGAEHSLALRVGGIAYSWGANDASQLGDGLIAQRNAPFQIPNQGNLIAVAAGGAHSAALTKFGEVLVWGRNDDGQIGNRNSGTKGGPETIDTGKGRPALRPIAHVNKVSPPPGTSNGINSSSGTGVLVIKNLGYLSNDFGSSDIGATTLSTYTFSNQSIAPNGSLINNFAVSVSGTDFSLGPTTCAMSLLPGEACEFDIGFVPAAAGDRQGTLIVDSDITGSPQSFTLYGTGVGPMTPAMTLGVTQLPFAARPIASSEIETFLIGNDGTAALSVSSASTNLADFGVSHNCGSVVPATTCTVTVTFIPAASGTRSATLTIIGNAGTQTVALSGSGVNALVDIDPAPFTFTAQNSVTVATLQTSNAITVSGIDTIAPVAVTNGEFSIGCTATFVTGTGTIGNGQTICVRHTSATTISTANTTTLKIGGVSGQFTTTTANTPLYALGIVKAGAGGGSVTALSPVAPALNCGLTCNANYNAGTAIELIATPNAGTILAGWAGCDVANGVRCTVTLNASRNITATFIASVSTVPGAPAIGIATAGNAQVSIAYTAPASSGGNPITHYTATCNPGAIRATSTSGGFAAPIIVTGLVNATPYACSVTAGNAAGTSAASAAVNVTPQAGVPFALIGVQSRKLHAGAGEYDVPIDTVPAITGNVTVEPRAIAAAHRIVFQFSGPVTQSGTATAVDVNSVAIGSIGGTRVQGNEVIVTLTNIPDASRVKVTLANVNGTGVGGQASIGFLIGDTNQTARVNAADVSGVKAHVVQATNGTNFRFDANEDGSIDAKDVSMVKTRAGWGLP